MIFYTYKVKNNSKIYTVKIYTVEKRKIINNFYSKYFKIIKWWSLYTLNIYSLKNYMLSNITLRPRHFIFYHITRHNIFRVAHAVFVYLLQSSIRACIDTSAFDWSYINDSIIAVVILILNTKDCDQSNVSKVFLLLFLFCSCFRHTQFFRWNCNRTNQHFYSKLATWN